MRRLIKNIKASVPLQYAALVLIAVMSAFNYEIFIRPNNFAPAGINGIATMVQYKLGFSREDPINRRGDS